MPKKRPSNAQFIPIDRCHLFGITSPHALAKRLGWNLNKLKKLAANGGYRVYPHKQTGRMIQEPGAALQSLHRQIHRYLARVQAPDYLHSAVKGRSYVSNAKAHIGNGPLFKIDISKFYQSVPQYKVMHFFRDTLNCSPDVSGLLAKLICFNGALATGSAASPIISYYTYKKLFDDLKSLADTHSLVMTCYVDDITMSGTSANRLVLHEARTLIFRAGLRAHKDHHFQKNDAKIVTGILVGNNSIGLPFSRWKKIHISERDIRRCSDQTTQLELYPTLVSRLYEAAQIDGRCRIKAKYQHSKWQNLQREVAKTSAQKFSSLALAA